MTAVRVDDPPTMNVLGLFLASSLRRNLVERGRSCALRGVLTVDAEGMRATIRFEDSIVTITRQDGPSSVVLSAPLSMLVQVLVRPTLRGMLRIKTRGSRLFALRAMRFLKP